MRVDIQFLDYLMEKCAERPARTFSDLYIDELFAKRKKIGATIDRFSDVVFECIDGVLQ